MTVDHINRVRHDNRLENLRWSTAKQQIHNQTRKIHKTTIKDNAVHQLYLKIVSDQREYFVNNVTPKFNKQNYIYLTMMYDLYNSVQSNNITDPILKKYVENYISFNFGDSDITTRSEFYDYFYSKIRQYHSDKAKEIASQTTTESIDVSDFEKIFKDKKYVKKEFKEYCMSKFSLKKEVFKK